MLRSYIDIGPTLSYIIGFLGIGFSMSSLPVALRVIIGIISVLILLFTAGIRLEDYLEKRHDRLMRDQSRGMKAFLTYLRSNEDEIKDLDADDIEDLNDAHRHYVEDSK